MALGAVGGLAGQLAATGRMRLTAVVAGSMTFATCLWKCARQARRLREDQRLAQQTMDRLAAQVRQLAHRAPNGATLQDVPRLQEAERGLGVHAHE